MMQPLEMIKNEIVVHGVKGIVHSNYGEKMDDPDYFRHEMRAEI
jgi:hypothetical protein